MSEVIGLKSVQEGHASLIRSSGSTLGVKCLRLVAAMLLLVLGQAAWAADYDACSKWPLDPERADGAHLIDGENLPSDLPSFGQMAIDVPCTIRNFTPSNPFTWNISYPGLPEGSLVIFDNVYSTGQMSCGNMDGVAIWAVNGTDFPRVGESCQEFFVPVEKINKTSPSATATVGIPFTYTLTIPVMYAPVFSDYCEINPTQPVCEAVVNPELGSPNPLGSIHVWDDLSAAATNAEMTLVDINAYWKGSNTPITVINNGTDKYLDFTLPDISAGEQVIVEITVVLDDVAGNVPGTVFQNTAEWEFARNVDTDGDGVADQFFNPLPGERGQSQPMTIAAPDLVMTKTTTATAVSLENIPYVLDVENVGGWDAWNVVVKDKLPEDTSDNSGVGLCELDPTGTVNVEVRDSGYGLLRTLSEGVDYDPPVLIPNTGNPADRCSFEVRLTEAAGPIAPGEHLIVTFETRLDPSFDISGGASGELYNIAGITEWWNAPNTEPGSVEILRNLSDITAGPPFDYLGSHEDVATVSVALTGYYFEKTVENLTTSEFPAATVAPGDRLRYTLRLFNVEEDITNIDITDALQFGLTSPSLVSCQIAGSPVSPCGFTGNTLSLSAPVLNQGNTLEIVFEVDVASAGLVNGQVIDNQAFLTASGISYDADSSGRYPSDDPFTNGVSDPTDINDQDPTSVTVVIPPALDKASPADTEVAIGEEFDYTLTVPATAVSADLYDVHILDNLPDNLSFVSATADVNGTTYTLLDSDNGADNSLDLQEAGTGLDIPAGQQAVVTLKVQVRNDLANQDGVTFNNTASYTYSRTQGGAQSDGGGTADTAAEMRVVEPSITAGTATKTVENITRGGTTAQGGDILEYTVTLPNTGTSPAYDVAIVDTLPSGVSYVANTAEITLSGSTTNVEPGVNGNQLSWGRINSDDILDIPVGETLTLVYRVQVDTLDSAVPQLVNSVLADWTSLDNVMVGERTGSGAPDTAALNDYFVELSSSPLDVVDNSGFTKSVQADSWDDGGMLSTGVDGELRIGDTVTYALTLSLNEGQTAGVTVTDTLPTGLELVSSNYEFGSNINFTPVSEPAAGDRGALVWNLGDITNTPDTVSDNDELVIEVVSVVVANDPDTLAHTNTTVVTNTAELSYVVGAANPIAGQVDVTVNQPLMSDLLKSGTGTDISGGSGEQADPYQVSLAGTVMDFTLQSCNAVDPAAPAYGVVISDTLASQFDETTLSDPVVQIDSITLSAGTDYAYTPPAGNGGSLSIALLDTAQAVVAPGQCVTVTYSIGLRSDVSANTSWSNEAGLTDYWSLPANAGQHYTSTATDSVWLINDFQASLPTKAASKSEATIGEEVVYTITVPGTPVNAELNGVTVTDILDPALQYVDASVDLNGSALGISPSQNGQELSWDVGTIPAGQQAVITLTTWVANTQNVNASGTPVGNTASYSYLEGGVAADGGTSSPADITIVEPDLAMVKDVVNLTDPGQPAASGDELEYTLTITNNGTSTAFDTNVADTLPAELSYIDGSASATIDGSAVASFNSAPSESGNTLTWGRDNGDGSLVIPAGSVLVITYRVNVDIVTSEDIVNSALADWTSLSGDFTSGNRERTGAGCPNITAPNSYCSGATSGLSVDYNIDLTKAVVGDSWNGNGSLRVGDTVEYEVQLALVEGTHNNLVLTDSLPQGLAFVEMVSADYFGAPPATMPVPDVSADLRTVTWTIDQVTNPVDGDTSNDFLTIVYRARVQNGDSLSQQPTSQSLTNAVSLNYEVGGVAAAPLTASATVTALQPLLAVSKSGVTAVGGDAEIAAGETATYTVDITNNGNAPAYDTVLVDTLPVGLRQNGVTPVSATLVNAGSTVSVTPVDDAVNSGTVTWDFDTANNAVIEPGETLRIVYEVTGDNDLPAGVTLTNSAQVSRYYSFDNDQPPVNSPADWREEYGPSEVATFDLTAAMPGVLSKATSQDTVAIGGQLTYTITVPETPADVALQDVRITDNLAATGVDLAFVSATFNGSPLTNTGTADNLVLIDSSNGIDIAAGSQAEVLVTVAVLNTDNNRNRTEPFVNRAWYGFDNGFGLVGDDTTTGADANPVTIVHPELVVEKTGPASLKVGTPDNFVLTVANTGEASAWNVTLTDWLPNAAPGGMCDMAPTVQSAVIQKADSSTVTLAPADFAVSFTDGDPTCQFVMTLQTDDELAPGESLSVTYQVALDEDNIHGSTLINIAGATEWFSADSASTERFAYQRQLTDGTPGVVDHEDNHEFIVEAATLETRKTVFNVTTGESGATASPGDRLRYTIEIQNTSDVPLNGFTLIDELDRLNATAMFEADSLAIVTLPSGATESVLGNGGTRGSGLLEVNDLAIAAAGQPGDTLTIEFEGTLVPVITSGTVVLNQAQLSVGGVVFGSSDDPALGGAEDPTETLIDSGPLFDIDKTSEDLTGDAAMLLPGDTLRYTLTVRNIGGEDAVAAVLRDQVPANTTYVANSTTLNGAAVTDVNGGSPLSAGLTISSPGADAGVLLADPTTSGDNQAVISFEVTVNDVSEGTLISNQGFLSGDGAGSGAFEEAPSDDPATDAANDPTIDIVGEVPLLVARKDVVIQVDNLSAGIVDPGDTLRYTIVVDNLGGVDATEASLTDLIPANTTYVAGSTTLNGIAVSDNGGGDARIATGLPISSEDLTPPLPGALEGVISSGRTATIVFDVTVDAGTATGTVISNQGSVDSAELPLVLTDADGNPANGAQPTEVVVGDAQQLAIVKEVSVVNGAAEAGATLEYLVTVTNISAVPASNVVITDDLLVAGDGALTYVADSARLNGQSDGITVNGSVISADYSAVFGELQPEDTATLRFQARLGADLAIGTTVVNTAMVEWNDPPSSTQASVSIDVGGTPGIANLAGYLWRDVNLNTQPDTNEQLLQNWTVELYFNGNLVETAQSDENGYFQFDGLLTNMTGGASYELRYVAPGAGVNTASLGNTDSDFTNGPQQITEIYVGSGANLQDLNLPLTPNGVVYDSVVRGPVAGATLTMLRASSGVALPDSCFDDPRQQGQVTQTGGFYKFDINFSGAGCPAGSDYLIQVELPGGNYVAGESAIIPPQTNAETAGFDVAACLGSAGDAVPATTEHCEAQPAPGAPPIDIDAQSPATNYYLRLRLDDNRVPGESQLFNNHIAVDPQLDGALSITKTSSMLNVTRSQLVPYTITFSNTLGVPLTDLELVDFFPAGFKYVPGSARVDGVAIEPEVEGLQLRWSGLRIDPQQTRTAKLLLVVSSGVGEGEYVNRAQLFNGLSGQVVSGEAFATVRVIPDPTFDCTDVIGKVYDDKNMNGYQDAGEGGVPGARVVTATGLNATTDAHGRFHITCAVVPDQNRGSNFVLKLDDRSLPSGYRLTSENPRVVRATRGKMIKVNFGSSLHRVVRLDMAEGVFEPERTEMRPQWHSRTELLLEKLQEAPSVLRLSYLAENEDPDLVERRLQVMKARIADEWARDYGDYELTIETEVFWRRGAPPSRGGWK
ncbi:isopeptide-forming domain-containing fimbrial protein [Microbulbifer guangxiensis]|uniref:isopeptide-forming domain-containing fimbrial protein n=1 Tax=Microbulbifer guangxiensis TaxID=2904249 RepID=UPI001F00C3E7|nr:isopeptide-forming domain-containing fimbrial protein [Microbulbifer guangxiensis]